MATMNKVLLLGRLGSDPELRYPQGSTQAVCNFSLATTESWKDKSGEKKTETLWHRIVVWGKTAEACGSYLKKGSSAFVEGKLKLTNYTDKTGLKKQSIEVVASSVLFVSEAKEKEQVPAESFTDRLVTTLFQS